ncbi:MAG: WbqC family protein [Bacteroidota bacterium]
MKKGICLRTPLAYFPPAHWYLAAIQHGVWMLEAHENYQKGGFRNRCRIASPNGLQTLSVPLESGKHQAQPIQEVRISYQRDWWREHEQSIRTAYGRSPYFEFYADDIFAVGRTRPTTLWELNHQLFETILNLLQNPFSAQVSSGFLKPGTTGFVWPNGLPQSLPEYPQVFSDRHGFTPSLSILDALFCLGPEIGSLVTRITPLHP